MTPASLLLARSLGPLLVFSVAAGGVAAALAARTPAGVEVALGFVVPVPRDVSLRGGGEPATDPVEATDLFVGTLTGWLSSPDFVARVYARASVAPPVRSLRHLSRVFTAERRGGQVVGVRFRARTADDGARIARAVREELGERAQALQGGGAAFSFTVRAEEPLIVPVRVLPAIRGLVAGTVVFVLALNAVFLWDFLRAPPAGAGVSG